jgi:FkbM family methyltransferase
MDTVAIKAGPVTVDLLGDDRIAHRIKAGKRFEPESLTAWADMCEAGRAVVDVGAYSGLFSIAAAKLGATAVAIEPQPVMCERIHANALLNMVAFEVINAAASDEAGTARLSVNPAVRLTSGASLIGFSGGGFDVKTIRLDDLMLKDVSAIKIDVEKAELMVLRGAAETLARCKPKLLIEALDVDAVNGINAALPGYRLARFLDQRNMLMLPA